MNEVSQAVSSSRIRPPTFPSTKTKTNASAAAHDDYKVFSGAFFAGAHSFDIHGGEFNSVMLPNINNFNVNRRRRRDQ